MQDSVAGFDVLKIMRRFGLGACAVLAFASRVHAEAAPAAPPAAGGGDPASSFGPMIWTLLPMIIIFYLLLIRPENKRRKAQLEMLGQMKKNDKVLMNSGLYGTIADIDGEEVTLVVDAKKDVRVKCRREAIASIVTAPEKSEKK